MNPLTLFHRTGSLKSLKTFSLVTKFKNMNERAIQLKFKEFVEILNMLDEEWLINKKTEINNNSFRLNQA